MFPGIIRGTGPPHGQNYIAEESTELSALVYLKSWDVLVIKREFLDRWRKYVSNLGTL